MEKAGSSFDQLWKEKKRVSRKKLKEREVTLIARKKKAA